MKIKSNGIVNGSIQDKHGKHGTQFAHNRPSRSMHISWSELPTNTKSLALIFIDHDAIPVCGFSWIHWTVANIDPKIGELPENASTELALLEGANSWSSPLLADDWRLSVTDSIGYGGCAPPDATHLYTIELYALDTTLNLKRGFLANELINAMNGHILDRALLTGAYRS